jgi:hypothetical protein
MLLLSLVLVSLCGAALAAQTGPASAPDVGADQTAAIQAKLNQAAKAGGGEVRLPPGRHVVLGNLTVPTGVALSGSWEAPHHGIVASGTVLEAYAGRGDEAAAAFITLRPSSAVRGLTVFYPRQRLDDIQPYPWTIHGEGMHNTIENVTLVNSYNGIAIGLEHGELHLIRNVFGCVLRRGVFIDNTTDIGRIENVHFNPHYWQRSRCEGAPETMATAAYMQRNLEAFVFGRTDWQYVANTFVFGAKIGYHFIKTQHGACNGQFVGIGADACQYPVVVDAMQPISLLISNGQFVCIPMPGNEQIPFVGVTVGTDAVGGVQLVNCSWWGSFDHFVMHEAPACRLSIAHATMTGAKDTGIELRSGMAYVEDLLFNQCRALHVRVGPDVRGAVIRGIFNLGHEGVRIDNQAGAKAQLDIGPASQPAGRNLPDSHPPSADGGRPTDPNPESSQPPR